MLAINRTNIVQIVYDHFMEPRAIDPGGVAYVGEQHSAGIESVSSLAKLFDSQEGITIRRSGGIGDLLYLTPALAALRAIRECHFLVKTAPAFVGLLDGLEFVETLDIRDRRKTDINLDGAVEIADQEGWGKSMVRSSVFARILGVLIESTRPVLKSDYRLSSAMDRLGLPIGPLIVFQIEAAARERSLPEAEAKELASRLVSIGNVIVVDRLHRSSWDTGPWINLSGKLSIAELVALVDRSDVVVGLESGVSLIGEALAKPTLMLIGVSATEARIGPDWRTRPYRLERGAECLAGGNIEKILAEVASLC